MITVKAQVVKERGIKEGDVLRVLSHWQDGKKYCYLVESQSDYNVPIVLYHEEIKLMLDN